MRRGFRARLTTTVIALVVAAVAIVSVTSYVLVRQSLRDQLVADSIDLAEFAVLELASTAQLPVDADRVSFEDSGLTERFLRRGVTGVFVDFGDADPYASSPEYLSTPALISPEVVALVDRGNFGYQFLQVSGDSLLVVAAERPSGPPVMYLFFDAGVVEQALGNLWRFLAVGAGVVIAISVITAGAVARGVLRPVRTAGAAAQQLAAGDLATRVSVESDDEFGRMSEAFNTMAATVEAQIVALEEAEARERRFVADVSHELRTPLTGLSNEAQLLEAGLHTIEGPTRRAAELLIGDVGRLCRLVDELLEISRLESGDASLDLTETDLARFLQAMITARLPGAHLVVSAAGPVLCDRRGLERIVGNLLDNAAAHAPGATVEVAASVTDGMLRLTVSDDGPGIDDESLDRLFDRFFKSDPARQGGSGLGLAIARQHARRLGGDITVARRPVGSGLRFELAVPVTVLLPDGDDDETGRSHDEGVTDETERRMS